MSDHDHIQKQPGSSTSTAAKPHLTHTASGSPLPPTNGTSQPHTSVGGTTTSDRVKEKGKEKEKDSLEKPSNVFKNDGSFLARFQKPKEPSAEDKKAAAVAQKKAFEDRFRKRGKRPLPVGEDESKNKKPKTELSAYEKEVAKYESRVLKDTGSGVRAIMK